MGQAHFARSYRVGRDRSRRTPTGGMPAALLVINGKKDQLFDLDGVQQSFDKIESCYKKAGIGDRVRPRFYDTPHEFNNEMQAEAWEWLRKWV